LLFRRNRPIQKGEGKEIPCSERTFVPTSSFREEKKKGEKRGCFDRPYFMKIEGRGGLQVRCRNWPADTLGGGREGRK